MVGCSGVADDFGDDGGGLRGADVESSDEAFEVHCKPGDHLVAIAEVELGGALIAAGEVGFNGKDIPASVAGPPPPMHVRVAMTLSVKTRSRRPLRGRNFADRDEERRIHRAQLTNEAKSAAIGVASAWEDRAPRDWDRSGAPVRERIVRLQVRRRAVRARPEGSPEP